ncbi:MAG: HAD family hydrolase [Leptonema sp. (in: bacteria)]
MILIFDLMDTLIEDPFFSNFYNHLNQHQKKNWLFNTNYEAYKLFEEGKILEYEYFRNSYKLNPKELNLLPPQKIKKRMLKEIRFLKGIPELLTQIKKKQFTLILASNYSIWYWEIFKKKKELEEWFDYIFFSCEMGVRKPEKRFFSILHNAIQNYCEPNQEILYFDDNQENIKVIKKLNFQWECEWIYDKQQSSQIIYNFIKKKCPQF